MIISVFKTLYKTFAILMLMIATSQALLPRNDVKTNEQALHKKNKNPAHSLSIWAGILDNPHKFTPSQLMNFLESHAHWPNYKRLCENAERVIAKRGRPQEILVWFATHPPQTPQGIMAYASFLPKPTAAKIIIEAWETKEMSASEEKQFLAKFADHLSKQNHATRLNHLLWNEDFDAAKRLFPHVSSAAQQTAKLRMALMQGSSSLKLPPTKDEGLLYEVAKNHKANKKWDAATKILVSTLSSRNYADKWWKLRNYIAREFIQLKNYKKAYLIVKKHNLEPGTPEFAEAQWLLGWLSLRFLKKPVEAQRHFELLTKNVKAAISVSRAAYWLARAYEDQKKLTLAKRWYRKSAYFKTTFYGQLSAHKLHQDPYPVLREAPQATDKERRRFEQNDLVRAAHLLKAKGKKADDDLVKVLTCIASQAKTKAERELTVQLAHKLAPHVVVWIARKAGKQDPVLLKMAYPTCPLPTGKAFPEKALLFAIAYKESDFNPKAISPKGAMGVLQLISSTAAQAAKQLGVRHSTAKLFEPAHNLLLGSSHVSSLLQKYSRAYLLVAAAYNAGPRPVERWVKDFGKPHKKKVDIIDWIELIPYAETRNYVQRVLENITVYRSHAGPPQKTLVDDLKQKT